MAVICPNCAEPNRKGARFCDACGTKLESLPPGPLQDRAIELRQGTVLFCDLVRSTRLANTLDPEDLKDVFKRFQDVVEDVLDRHSGHLIQLVGDGAFALFGYPKAREDAAESALDSALAFVEAVRRASPVRGAVLSVRVGVASGTVVVGELEREAAAYEQSVIVIGSIVHLAARLVTKAQPGRVAIDDATKRLSGRFFDYRDLGRLRLKGFDESVQAWQVLRASSIASRFEAKHSDRTLPAIVGRAEPLERIRESWARATRGESIIVIVDGDAGVGKSRLAREIRREVLHSGATVLDIDCSPRTANTPLSPIATLLRRAMGRRPNDSDAAPAHARAWLHDILGAGQGDQAFPYLAPLLGIDSPSADSAESPDRVRERMIGVLVDIVRALAAKHPLFILCEDAHWSDPTTLELLRRVSTDITGLPVLGVVTIRSSDGDSRQLEIPGAEAITLSPLSAADAAEIVHLTAAEERLGTEIVERIVTRCEGNPLYLEEATRSVLEAAGERGRGFTVRTPEVRDVPNNLQTLVETRLDRLPSVKPIIQAAAVVGRDFPLALIELLLPGRVDIPQATALLVERDLLVRYGEKASGSLRFKHALIHDAVYQTIVKSERQRLHSQTADLLARHFAGQPESAPDLLAHHLAAARRDEEATFALAEASDLAAARAAHVESIGHSRAALALAEHIDDDRTRRQLQRRLLIRLGVASAAIEGYASPEVLKAYDQARELCAAQDDPAVLFPVVRGLGTFHFVRGDLAEAHDLSEQCLSLARRSGRTDLLIEALSFHGYPAHYRGRLSEARRTLEECLAVYRAEHGQQFVYPSAQDPATAACSLLITTMWLQGDAQASEAATRELLEHVNRLNRPFDEAYAHVWMSGLRHLQRRVEEALEHANIGIAIAQKHGYNTWLATAVMMSSMATALSSGSLEAIECLRTTHRAFMQAGANVSASFYMWGLARALAIAGQKQQARDVLTEARRLSELSGESYMTGELLTAEAELEDSEDAAIGRLQLASRTAEEHGETAVALRATSACVLRRHGSNLPQSVIARTVLLALDGRAPYPTDHDWMHDALRALRSIAPFNGPYATPAAVDAVAAPNPATKRRDI